MSASPLPSTLPLLFLVAGGFALLRLWGATRTLHGIEPARVYVLFVGSAGLALSLVSAAAVVLCEQAVLLAGYLLRSTTIPGYDRRLVWDPAALLPSEAAWKFSTALAFFLGVCEPILLNRLQLSRTLHTRLLDADLANSALGRLAIRSLESSLPMALTLDTGHVIVGHPVSLESFSAVANDVAILPFASGYRSDPEQELVLTTSYGWIYQLEEDEKLSFVKAVARERIVSANLFDERRYLQFVRADDESASTDTTDAESRAS